jgi:hypothetical protein
MRPALGPPVARAQRTRATARIKGGCKTWRSRQRVDVQAFRRATQIVTEVLAADGPQHAMTGDETAGFAPSPE